MVEHAIHAFRTVPRTGVIYVTAEAAKKGYRRDPEWCNLGQGQPETGPLPGAPPRVHQALDRKVICVPGEFFDVNPGKRRSRGGSRFKGYVRFSFGPAMPVLEAALGRLGEMIAAAGR